jgi:methyl-accepting chemotaxis protein
MFKNLTIGKKIAFGFTSVLALTAILATLGVVQISTVDVGVMDLAGVHIPLSTEISEIDAAATSQNLQVSLYAIHKEEVQLQEFTAMDEAVDEAIEHAKAVVNSDAELVELGWLDKINEIAQLHDTFGASCQKMIEVLKNAESNEEKIETVADAVEAEYEPLMAKIDGFLEINATEATDIGKGCEKAADTAKFWLLTIGVSAVLIGAVLAFFISRGIITALKQIINRLSEGS